MVYGDWKGIKIELSYECIAPKTDQTFFLAALNTDFNSTSFPSIIVLISKGYIASTIGACKKILLL